MYTSEGLIEFHNRTHESLKKLIKHCGQFQPEELDKEIPGFGYSTLRRQIHHAIGAEKYWAGVLEGRMDINDDVSDCETIEKLEEYRKLTFDITGNYFNNASSAELNNARPMMTWGNKEKVLVPAQVFMRTLTHAYQHQGQIMAMCRILGKPVPAGLDYPIA